jgi:hypothetical protein
MKNKALVAAAIVATIMLAVASYKVYEIHTIRSSVVALLKDASEHLRPALVSQVAGGDGADVEAHAAATETHVSTLRNMRTSSLRGLADAADDALVTSREIMRRHVDMKNARARLSLGLETLAAYVKSDRGASDWTREAVRLKSLVDKDFRDYKIAVESYASLLDAFPSSQAKLAPYVDAALLIDEKLIRDARRQALDAYAGTDQNVRRVSTLQSYRVDALRAR